MRQKKKVHFGHVFMMMQEMKKVIKFKPEFEKKLKELHIRCKFMKELRKSLKMDDRFSRYGKTLEERIIYLNTRSSWSTFIDAAFAWETTQDKTAYWMSIQNS